MTSEKIGVNKIATAICTGAMVTTFIMLAALWHAENNTLLVLGGLLFALLLFLWMVLFIVLVRKKLNAFTSAICQTLDDMMNNSLSPMYGEEEEMLHIKINHRLERLYDVMQANRRRTAEEKNELQELISDISHQVKTPIANLKMINSLLLEPHIPKGKQQEFLRSAGGQLDKLDFLIQSMIKTSRLETGIITLVKKDSLIYETLAEALGGILLDAEKKQIEVTVDCPESLTAAFDAKWTGEALFNILDNAVKYTDNGGRIHVSASPLERYAKIEIADSGKGISENHYADIFKRFYREEEVHHIDGIGIGLFLARKIVTMQGGYIKVASQIGKGSTFSVFLPSG